MFPGASLELSDTIQAAAHGMLTPNNKQGVALDQLLN